MASYASVVGKVIAQLRSEKGLDQVGMANAVGIGQSTWSRLENGDSALSIDQLSKVAELLGVEPSQILIKADQVVSQLKADQVSVVSDRLNKNVSGANLLFGAALALLVLKALKK